MGVPPGAAAVLEFAARAPGKFGLMDHSIARMSKGLMALFDVSGPDDGTLIHAGVATPQQTAQLTGVVSGMTKTDEAVGLQPIAAASPGSASQAMATMDRASMIHMGMSDMGEMNSTVVKTHAARTPRQAANGSPAPATTSPVNTSAPVQAALNGCLVLANDGKVILNVFQSRKTYRLEARPLLFSANANRLVHVSGYFGSVMAVEDPALPSFVVNTVDAIAPNCTARISSAQIQKALAKRTQATRGVVGMSDMGFLPQTIVINAGEKVVWTNSSQVTHNVVADPGRAVFPVDVKLPSGVNPFGSGILLPGQTFSRAFDVPGIYRYVCTLHETSGMKGVIIVRGAQVLRASK